jgi:hypothetical protein
MPAPNDAGAWASPLIDWFRAVPEESVGNLEHVDRFGLRGRYGGQPVFIGALWVHSRPGSPRNMQDRQL